ncbi:dTDP-4-dehydrorhamnose reductase [Halomonas sp. BC04]|uniref:dTDP-4-dehydrorhamnose reductase n=1 Tax=Halomonas sp. BC04 TaxID=1403540 RepID=UPI0003ED6AAC|nr:dTDP-4-dehydrorhamnose reductase [Halomonas sp. BC04]EWG98236.1 dTDP-4-dehydrorhamnose reductase [Halomonas sp. BC04]
MTLSHRVLITGSTGQVGFELVRLSWPLGQVLAPGRQLLDLANAEAVESWLESYRPDLILNTAAFTAVDRAESDIDLAWRLNARLPAQLAEYCAHHGSCLVHYSSDYVYPGQGSQALHESDGTEPLNAYGRTKLAGDEAVMASKCRYWLFRTSWVYSARGHNFMKSILRLARERDSLQIVDDQVGAPTPARLIAQVTIQALMHRIPAGLYHLTTRGEISWHGFASEILRLAQCSDMDLLMSPHDLIAIPAVEYPTPARRPLNSRLNIGKLEQALRLQLPDWQSQLELTLAEYLVN